MYPREEDLNLPLSEYHHQFLSVLCGFRVQFLVIGGQARVLHNGGTTTDLDVWAQAGVADQDLENALVSWVERYPAHISPFDSYQRPLKIRDGVQIHFPVQDALFQSSSGEPSEILAAAGIDVLTSLPPLKFKECFARAERVVVEDCELSFLSREDFEHSQRVGAS